MDPREFQRFAERLTAGVPRPAECRSAISRAYYAAFNVGAEILRDLGFPVGRGAAAHGEVRHCLANCGDTAVAAAVSQLADLHTQRNRADYHLDRADVEQPGQAQMVVRMAADVIHTFDTGFRGAQRLQLKAAIGAWRKANGYP